MTPNAQRGEAAISVGDKSYLLRPTFAALVAAEEELGALFALVERAAAGELKLAEMAALFWHCISGRPDALTRDMVGEAIAAQGLAAFTPQLKILLRQVLQGTVN